MKKHHTILYVIAGYLATIALAEFISAQSANSPTADTIAALPSIGSLLGQAEGTSQGVTDLVSAATLTGLVYYGVL